MALFWTKEIDPDGSMAISPVKALAFPKARLDLGHIPKMNVTIFLVPYNYI